MPNPAAPAARHAAMLDASIPPTGSTAVPAGSTARSARSTAGLAASAGKQLQRIGAGRQHRERLGRA